MSNIRRYYEEGYTYFITVVTHKRKPIIIENIDLIRGAFKTASQLYKFEITAWVFLPDHLHAIIHPDGNTLSEIIRRFKQKFSGLYRSRYSLAKGRVWQYRFWDHVIRDQDDYNRHLDYIHYNPVKHGLAKNPFLYESSSIHKFDYPPDWGILESPVSENDYGE